MGTLRLGTRGSALARAQSALVARSVAELGEQVEVVTIATSGDEGPRAQHEDKARFVKEIEQALLREEIDLAVHSAKDVPAELPAGLAIAGVPARADPRDALCGFAAIADLPDGARVGTASLRRRAQLAALRPDLELVEARGNVDTRLRHLAEGAHDALVLAAAGLERLGRAGEGVPIPVEVMTPAAGQGCLLLEARAGAEGALDVARRLNDPAALAALTAERALVGGLDASCDTPVGALARPHGDGGLEIAAFAGAIDGSGWIRDRLDGSLDEPADLGLAVAERMLAAGAAELLTRS